MQSSTRVIVIVLSGDGNVYTYTQRAFESKAHAIIHLWRMAESKELVLMSDPAKEGYLRFSDPISSIKRGIDEMWSTCALAIVPEEMAKTLLNKASVTNETTKEPTDDLTVIVS